MSEPGREPGSELIQVGVLVTVPDPVRTRLARWRRIFGDQVADVVPPHVTLLAPAVVAADALPDVEAHLLRVLADEGSFAISLRGSGSFRPVSPVVYAALAAGRAACERLQARIRTGPLAVPLRFPYHPHITVAHGGTDPQLDAAEHMLADLSVDFGVRTVDLYQAPVASGAAVRARTGWVLQRRFALVGRDGALVGRDGALGRAGAPGRRRDRSSPFVAARGGS